MTTGRDVPRVSPSERLQLKTMRAALRERPPCSGGSCGDAELAWAARSLGVLSRLPVAYLHLSKAGGTAVCSVAERLNVSAPRPSCWMRALRDAPHWWFPQPVLPSSGKLRKVQRWLGSDSASLFSSAPTLRAASGEAASCHGRAKIVREAAHRLVSNENWLPPGGVCAEFFASATMLREPLARILSHWRHMRFVLSEHPALASIPSVWSNSDLEARLRAAPAVADNLLVRSLLGRRGYELPLGGVARAHYAQARLQIAV